MTIFQLFERLARYEKATLIPSAYAQSKTKKKAKSFRGPSSRGTSNRQASRQGRVPRGLVQGPRGQAPALESASVETWAVDLTGTADQFLAQGDRAQAVRFQVVEPVAVLMGAVVH